MIRNPLWRQDNPRDQLTAILMGLQGEILNVQDGVTSSDQIEQKTEPFIQMLKQLGEWLQPTWGN